MLQQAIAVVEAARRLQSTPMAGVSGRWKIGCRPSDLQEILKELAETIDAFDASSRSAQDPFAAIARAVHFAESKGIDRGEMIAAMRGAPVLGDDDADEDREEERYRSKLDPKPHEIGPPNPKVADPVLARGPNHGTAADAGRSLDSEHGARNDVEAAKAELARTPTPSPRSTMSAVALAAAMRKPGQRLVDADRALAMGDDDSFDLEGAVDAIEDRLEAVVGRVGHSSQINRLRAAARRIREMAGAADRAARISLALELSTVTNEVIEIEMDNEPYHAPAFGR